MGQNRDSAFAQQCRYRNACQAGVNDGGGGGGGGPMLTSAGDADLRRRSPCLLFHKHLLQEQGSRSARWLGLQEQSSKSQRAKASTLAFDCRGMTRSLWLVGIRLYLISDRSFFVSTVHLMQQVILLALSCTAATLWCVHGGPGTGKSKVLLLLKELIAKCG